MRVQLEKRGVLGAGQVKKGGSLPRHIPILNIYASTPPGESALEKLRCLSAGGAKNGVIVLEMEMNVIESDANMI